MSAPATCRPPVRLGRPRKEHNAMMELQVRSGEFTRMLFKVGPPLRRLSMSDNQMVRSDVRLIVAQLAKLSLQDQHRTP